MRQLAVWLVVMRRLVALGLIAVRLVFRLAFRLVGWFVVLNRHVA